MKFYFVILLYASLESFHAANAKKDLSSEFTNSTALDEAQKVTLYWSVDWKARSISFAVEAQTTGWVGFGISSGRGQMIGADIVIGGVTDDGNQYFTVGYVGLASPLFTYSLSQAPRPQQCRIPWGFLYRRKLRAYLLVPLWFTTGSPSSQVKILIGRQIISL